MKDVFKVIIETIGKIIVAIIEMIGKNKKDDSDNEPIIIKNENKIENHVEKQDKADSPEEPIYYDEKIIVGKFTNSEPFDIDSDEYWEAMGAHMLSDRSIGEVKVKKT